MEKQERKISLKVIINNFMHNYSFDICWKYCIISGYSTSMVRNGKNT